MYKGKIVELKLGFFIIIILFCYILLSYAENKNLKPYPYPLPELSFNKSFWSLFFNEVFPKARFEFIIKNRSKMNISEGILILEIAEDEGLAIEPKREEFKFLSYKLFETIKPDRSLKLVFSLPDDYKPGRFRIKPTLFIYPQGKSPIKPIYEKMKSLGGDIFKAWENIYFSEWDKNLGTVLGTLRREGGSYLVVVRGFYDVLGITGISLLAIIVFCFKGIKKLVKRSDKIKTNDFICEPKIYLKRAIKNRYSLGEIYNSGNEDIIELEVVMVYIDKSGNKQIKKASFIYENENPLFASYHTSNILRQGERKFITDFPRTKVSVEVKGRGAKSNKDLKEIMNIEKEASEI